MVQKVQPLRSVQPGFGSCDPAWGAGSEPSIAKTMSWASKVETTGVAWCDYVKGSTRVPRVKKDFDAVHLSVFATPGSPRAQTNCEIRVQPPRRSRLRSKRFERLERFELERDDHGSSCGVWLNVR